MTGGGTLMKVYVRLVSFCPVLFSSLSNADKDRSGSFM